MANLCQQCSLELFNHDDQNLAFIGGLAPTHTPSQGYPALCEDCGYTVVNDEGICVSKNCLKKHGGERECQVSNTCT